MSPGLGWHGREPAALEAATATQASPRTVSSFLSGGLSALAAIARPLSFLVGGATPAHAPATATITGIDGETGEAATEIVYLPMNAAGTRVAGAVCSRTTWTQENLEVQYSAGGGIGATVSIGLGLIPGVADLRLMPIETWLEAFPDRSRPGILSPIQIDELVRDGSSSVDSDLTGVLATPFDMPPPTEAAKASRNRIIAAAAMIRTTVFKAVDREALLAEANEQIQRIRDGQSGIGQTPPDPARNIGGIVHYGGPRMMIDGYDGQHNGGDF